MAKSPATNRSSDVPEAGRLDLGEVAELAEVHAEDGDALRRHEVHGPQHAAVAAEADGHVQIMGELVLRDPVVHQRGIQGVDQREPNLVPLHLESSYRLDRQIDRLWSFLVQDQSERGHGPATGPIASLAWARARFDQVVPIGAGPLGADEPRGGGTRRFRRCR